MANCVMQLDLAHKKSQEEQQQADAAYNLKLQQCRNIMQQTIQNPTALNFWAGLGEAGTAYQNCMDGVPTIKRQPAQIIEIKPTPSQKNLMCQGVIPGVGTQCDK